MPGRLLVEASSGETGKRMGAYKLTSQDATLGSKMGRRFGNVEDRNSVKASRSRREAAEQFISEDDEQHSNESVFTGSSASTSADDDLEFASTRSTRTTVLDDDALLMEFASRPDDVSVAQPMRHSTACCSDLAFRRELRKRVPVETAAVDESAAASFALGNSFRLELEKEDRVESLALWEEREHRTTHPSSTRNVAASLATPHSWHAGDSSRNNPGLDVILRKKKSSFFHGFFSGLGFSASRKSRKSLS